ncbi:CDR ABC transporter [Penicillium expansum]|uniref:CDR ABC transporter n=1 Tax=Penicillium expansum TaxID=27334 RepID=A0A0A2IVW1_PENEN|nr:CDR ABC transporter [Penicillium expansum]KGO47179.1 CDR ABC transporter [Penicillium expansum]KGO52265.1 CDR ABC transporter [Penicillium expansum]KGO63458.1 CDR ABC transporter [Penicillium expansum]
METKSFAQQENEIDQTESTVTNVSESFASVQAHEVSPHAEHRPALDTSKEVSPLDSDAVDLTKWARRTINTLDPVTLEGRKRGVLLQNLHVHGSGSTLRVQHTVLSSLWSPFAQIASLCNRRKSGQGRQTILHGFDGLIQHGEMLLVLGRPGSGCTTFLKALCGRLDGLELDLASKIEYRGISFENMMTGFRGEVVYNSEADHHFPHLTVGETLRFAAYARAPHNRLGGMSREKYVQNAVKIVMEFFGLSHTYDSKVGDDYIRGVSGGERKRVSIAEMALSRASIAAWDNSTRGLDSASALDFAGALRLSADLLGSCHAVAAYQASENMYSIFDKVTVLYEGQQVYYGPCNRAVQYFVEMGWERPTRQTSADFIAAVTNPTERKPQAGMEGKIPCSPFEFSEYWKKSPDYASLQLSMRQHSQETSVDGTEEIKLAHIKHAEQADHVRSSSPYLISLPMQIRLCLARAFQRTRNDLPSLIATAIVQIVVAVIIGSLFFNIPQSSEGMSQRSSVIFLAVLTNALISMLEINVLYSQRRIVEKQTAFAFVHPCAEACAGIILDLPIKLFRCLLAGVILYFMANLRREASNFFIYILFQLTAVVAMSGMFRTLASMTRAIGQAMALAGIVIICIAVFTGFTLPQFDMPPWFGWIRWLNPIFYAYESIISNEFHGRWFECVNFVPADISSFIGKSFTCSSLGSRAGEYLVSGDEYIWDGYQYSHKHMWRNLGIMLAFALVFHGIHLVLVEYTPQTKTTAEALIFRPGHVPGAVREGDVESGEEPLTKKEFRNLDSRIVNFSKQNNTVSWKGLTYDLPVKGNHKRLLEDVNGWVKPGTLTALMGVSGAGKTTLLDVLAQRMTIGVVTGDVLVNGHRLDESFSRKTAYVHQQDLHLETATVREALRFNAILRQAQSVTVCEKYAFVEDVIQMLGMEDFAEAVIGIPGEGLNIEQRKLLSIGVELAAKPQLLIFLDEPTSGLDSQSSWTICAFMRKLADHGQAVLATIHQPGAILFEQFDRLLFLVEGGKTVYFGDVGHQAHTLLGYFENNGARRCGERENPAEYILDVVGKNANEQETTINWVDVWNNSPERQQVLDELDCISSSASAPAPLEPTVGDEFAMPVRAQFYHVIKRDFQQYYRQPAYILSKFALGIVCGLLIGFSFWKSNHSRQGFQNTLFSLFLLCTIFSTMVNQIMPKFANQRSLYELRERPSKTYSWKVFIVSQILVEVPWQILLGVCTWASFYFSVYGASQSPQSQGLVLLFIVQFFLFASTFAQFVIAALPNPALGSMIAVFIFLLSLLFNGILQPPSALPHFWKFMHHLSPLTYYVGGISATALHGREIHCSDRELSIFDPPPGQTCGQYLGTFLEYAPDQYLAGREIFWEDRWKDFGIFWAYTIFNILAAIGLYYLFRVLPHLRKTKARGVHNN